MEKQAETMDMFLRPKEELKKSAELMNELGDLWHSSIGYPFHIDPAGKWRNVPIGKQWQPICLCAPEWILTEFTECYSNLNNLKDTNEILKDFAYYLFRNKLQHYVTLERRFNMGGPYTVCFVGLRGTTKEEKIARAVLDGIMRKADDELQAVLKKLQSIPPDTEKSKQLMEQYMRLHNIQSYLARLAGDRVMLRSEVKK